jgi:hypothetical protein
MIGSNTYQFFIFSVIPIIWEINLSLATNLALYFILLTGKTIQSKAKESFRSKNQNFIIDDFLKLS